MINYGLIKQYPALQKFTDAQEQIGKKCQENRESYRG